MSSVAQPQYLSFDLGGIPDEPAPADLLAARLKTRQTDCAGDPYAALGALRPQSAAWACSRPRARTGPTAPKYRLRFAEDRVSSNQNCAFKASRSTLDTVLELVYLTPRGGWR